MRRLGGAMVAAARAFRMHAAPATTHRVKQVLAAPGRYYGGDGTIHGTRHLDVEVGPDGQVVAVWFRCQVLPFRVSEVDEDRAADMRRAYERNGVEVTGVEVVDP